MKYSLSLLLAAVLWLAPTTLFAQDKQQPPVTPATTNTPVYLGDENDVLGVGDVLDLQIGNHADMDQIAAVGRDGKVTLRGLGQFVAIGKTRAVMQNEIQVAADKTLNNAPVYLTMKEKHLERFTIDGGVTGPGVYPLVPGMKVLDAISAARGLPMKPIRYTGKLVRKNQTQTLNVPRIYSDPDSDANVTILPNDKIVINEIDLAHRRVTVLGQIQRPNTYDVESDTNVLMLISQSGGLLPAAALTKTTITRGSTIISLNLRPTYVKGSVDEAALNFRFQDGDVLSIPNVETKYQVLGQVNHPSSYVYPEQANITVLDALAAAGGQTPQADLKKAGIRRVVDGKPTLIKVDFESLNKKGVASANVPIQPDDILVIPERGKRGLTINDVLAPIGILNLLGFRLFN